MLRTAQSGFERDNRIPPLDDDDEVYPHWRMESVLRQLAVERRAEVHVPGEDDGAAQRGGGRSRTAGVRSNRRAPAVASWLDSN